MLRSGVIVGCLLFAGTGVARAEPTQCAPPAEWTHALRTATHVVVADRSTFHYTHKTMNAEWTRSWEATYVIQRVLLGSLADKQVTLKVSCSGSAATGDEGCLTPPAGQDLVIFLKKTRSGWNLSQRAGTEPCPLAAEVQAAGAKNAALFDELAKLAAAAEKRGPSPVANPFGVRPRPTTAPSAGDPTAVPSAAASAAANERPASEKPANEKPANERPANERPANEKPANEKPAAAQPATTTSRETPTQAVRERTVPVDEPSGACACATPPRRTGWGWSWLSTAPLALLAMRRRTPAR